MTKPTTPSPEQAARAERLAAQLRENLKRRKQQARGRRAENASGLRSPDEVPEPEQG